MEGLMLKLQYFARVIQKAWKRLWRCKQWKAGGEGDDRGWDGWMASLTQWTWLWASSGWWWRTRKPGVLQSMGSQRVGHPQNFYLVVTVPKLTWLWGIKSCVWWERQIGSMISDILGCLGVIVQGKIYGWMHGKERLTKNEEARCFYPIKLPNVCLTFPFVCI